ncbi:MAG: NADH-quinone oxidoreductase subunit K [candidate division Zixibacteria bacterium RBG_16_50_21]|nr:MAG: NADH-quinone oxidoreductase subunit K [candidate division Zixibacteria bacterium RBG_16_50_21]
MSMSNYLILSALVFGIGIFTVITRRNAIGILLGIELLLNAVNINLIAFAFMRDNAVGMVFVLFTIAITVAEVALGLAIVILIFRLKKTVQADEVNLLRG